MNNIIFILLFKNQGKLSKKKRKKSYDFYTIILETKNFIKFKYYA